MLDVEDGKCFEVMEEDDTENEQGTVAVTQMAVQRVTKSWFSIDADKAHGLQTNCWQDQLSRSRVSY